jgi:hypothetical protein
MIVFAPTWLAIQVAAMEVAELTAVPVLVAGPVLMVGAVGEGEDTRAASEVVPVKTPVSSRLPAAPSTKATKSDTRRQRHAASRLGTHSLMVLARTRPQGGSDFAFPVALTNIRFPQVAAGRCDDRAKQSTRGRRQQPE